MAGHPGASDLFVRFLDGCGGLGEAMQEDGSAVLVEEVQDAIPGLANPEPGLAEFALDLRGVGIVERRPSRSAYFRFLLLGFLRPRGGACVAFWYGCLTRRVAACSGWLSVRLGSRFKSSATTARPTPLSLGRFCFCCCFCRVWGAAPRNGPLGPQSASEGRAPLVFHGFTVSGQPTSCYSSCSSCTS